MEVRQFGVLPARRDYRESERQAVRGLLEGEYFPAAGHERFGLRPARAGSQESRVGISADSQRNRQLSVFGYGSPLRRGISVLHGGGPLDLGSGALHRETGEEEIGRASCRERV